MTHAMVTVMIEPEVMEDPALLEARVAELMARYDENMEVPEYEVECDCKGTGCVWCDGHGKRKTTYNPESRWDYYTITGKDVLAGNSITYSILVPEGGWQQQGTLGWFGISTDMNPDWENMWHHIFDFATEKGYKPIVLDYHI